MFQRAVYSKRREELMSRMTSGIVLMPANDESSMNYADNTYPFRQDSSFLYYFGVDFPGITGIMDVDNHEVLIFGDDYTIDDIVWMGPQPTIARRAGETGIAKTFPAAKLIDYLSAAETQGRAVHFLPPYRPEIILKLAQWFKKDPAVIGRHFSVELTRNVVAMREVKSAGEIEQIEQAVNVSVDMHVAAMKAVRPGMLEAEVAAKIHEVALAANGAISFPIIATINGQTLHNHGYGNRVKSGDLFLVDAGAENEMHYCGDLSSTFPVDRQFTTVQKEVYAASLLAHEAAIAAIAPGVAYKEVHWAACRSIVDSMKQMGLMKGTTDEAVGRGAHALFFPCGTGHMMGLDVHDMENLGEVWVGYDGKPKNTQFGLKSLRLAKALKPGFVLTVEPGIYFIPELMDLWRSQGHLDEFYNWDKIFQFKNFGGMRNEEDFVVTADGCRLLGKPKPKTIEQVEMLRQF